MDAPDPERLTVTVSAPARRAAWAVRPRAAATLVAILAALLTALATTAAPAASAATGTAMRTHQLVAHVQELDGVHLELDEVEPSVVRIGEPVTLSGRIVNDGTVLRRLSGVQVLAAWTPLGSRAEVSAWVDGEDHREAGWILGGAAVGPVVAAGQEIPFRLAVPAETFIGLPSDLTALAVEIRVHTEADANAVSLRTTLTVTRTEEVRLPLEHAWVVPLTLPPDPALASTEEPARHEAWHATVGPDSVIRTWLDTLGSREVTWLVDPSILVQLAPAARLTAEPPAQEPPEATPTGEEGSTQTGPPGTDTSDPTGSATAPPPAKGTEGSTYPASTGAKEAPETTREPAATAPVPTRSPAGRGLDVGGGLGSVESGETGPVVITREVVEEDLSALRDRLSEVPTEQLWWLPPADPDVAALLELGASPPTLRSTMDLPLADHGQEIEKLMGHGRDDVAWPVLAAPSADDVARMHQLWSGRPGSPGGLSVLMLPLESISGSSGAPVGRAAARLRVAPSVTAVGFDSRTSGLLAEAADNAHERGVGVVVQELLADNLAAYLQQPGEERSLVYGPQRDAEVPPEVLTKLTTALRDAPWTEEVGADELITAAGASEPVQLTGAVPDPAVLGELAERVEPPDAALDADRLRVLVRLGGQVRGLDQILAERATVDSWRPVLAQQWATRWRGAPGLWSRASTQLRSLLSATAAEVHVNPSTVNFLSDIGVMQVTVVNDLPVDVEGIRVQLTPDKSLLRIVEQPEPISIGAESRATVSFTAQAVARGRTTVTAHLTAPNGTRLGDDASVTVRVRPTGVWIYWVLGSAAGLVLLAGLSRALRAQPRVATVAGAPSDDEASEEVR